MIDLHTNFMIQVINRALDILELLSKNLEKEHSLNEISGPLNLNSGTCSNIIKTMVSRGYIEKKKGYTLGRQAYYLTNNFSKESEIIKSAITPMKHLSNILKESCVLSVLKNNTRRTLHNEIFVREIQANPGNELNAYQTATGKLLLAYLEPSDRNTFIKTYGLPGESWPEAQTENDLITELQKINKLGYAIHYTEADIVGIAMPIYNREKVVAGLGVYLPTIRYTDTMREKIFENLKLTAQHIGNSITF